MIEVSWVNAVQTPKEVAKRELADVAFASFAVMSDRTQTKELIMPGAEVMKSYISAKKPLNYVHLGEINIPFSPSADLYRLENGQRVLILNKKGPTVINTHFNVGSMNEPDELRGISHFVEHNLFNGTKELSPGEFFKKTNYMGAKVNASTGFAHTNYYINTHLLKENDFENALKMHADLISNPLFDASQIEKEKGPVTSEIAMYDDNPDNMMVNRCLKDLFQIESESKDLIAGRIDNINKLNREKVVDYYKNYYSADNAVTVITGEVGKDKAIEAVARHFNAFAPSKNPKRNYTELNPIQTSVRTDIESPRTSATKICLGFKGPESDNTKDQVVLDAIGVLLCNNSFSRLNKSLDNLAAKAEIGQEKISNKPGAPDAILLTTSTTEDNAESAIAKIYDVVYELGQNPPDAIEMKVIKNSLKLLFSNISESSGGLNDMLSQSVAQGNVNYLTDFWNTIENLTPQEVSDVARKYLDLDKVVLTVVHPESAESSNVLKTPSFKGLSNDKYLPVDTEKMEHHVLNNQAQVVLNDSKLPLSVFDMEIEAKVPPIVNPAAQGILSRMLSRGSALKDFDTFSKLTNINGMKISFATTDRGILVHSASLNDKMDEALALVSEVLTNPDFSQKNFETAKNKLKAKVESKSKSPNDKTFEYLYPQLPKFVSRQKLLEDIDTVTLDDVIGYYRYIMENAQLVGSFTGQFSDNPEFRQNILNKVSGLHSEFKPVDTNLFSVYKPNEKKVVLTQSEQRNQAEIMQTYTFKSTGAMDEKIKTALLNIVLGESPTSRLFSDLREDKKLAYKVYSRLTNVDDSGMISLFISTTTNDENGDPTSAENINHSLNGFDDNIHKLKTELVDEYELETAKNIMKSGVLRLMESSISYNATLLAGLETHKDPAFVNKLIEQVDLVSAEDLRNTAQEVFKHPPVVSLLASESAIDAARV